MTIFETTIESIADLDKEAMEKAKQRQDNLIKPLGSLGKLEDITIRLAGIYGDSRFDTSKKA
mgnify:CR=1 FL=1